MSRILIVEDEMHLAQGLRFNFEAEGHSVDITERGEDALTRLVKNREDFDALVLDVMLPGKDGFSVARESRGSKACCAGRIGRASRILPLGITRAQMQTRRTASDSTTKSLIFRIFNCVPAATSCNLL